MVSGYVGSIDRNLPMAVQRVPMLGRRRVPAGIEAEVATIKAQQSWLLRFISPQTSLMIPGHQQLRTQITILLNCTRSSFHSTLIPLMDPLSALSVAGNIIQFIQFGTQVLSRSHEIYRSSSGLSAEKSEIGAINEDVKNISQSVKLSLNTLQIEKLNEDLGTKNVDIFSASRELKDLNEKLKLSREGRESLSADQDDQALNMICNNCIDIADEMSYHLNRLKVKGQKHRQWKSLRQALKTVWRKEGMDNLVKRLLLFRGQLELHILASLR